MCVCVSLSLSTATTSPLSSLYSLIRSVLVSALLYGFCLGAINVSGRNDKVSCDLESIDFKIYEFVMLLFNLCILLQNVYIFVFYLFLPFHCSFSCALGLTVCAGPLGGPSRASPVLCVLRPAPGSLLPPEPPEQRPHHPLVSERLAAPLSQTHRASYCNRFDLSRVLSL